MTNSDFKIGQIIILECTLNTVALSRQVWEITAVSEAKPDTQQVVEMISLSKIDNQTLRVPVELLVDMTGYKRGVTVV